MSQSELARRLRRYHIRKAGVVLIDCDTFLSTCAALRLVGPLIGPEAVLVFEMRSGDELWERSATVSFTEPKRVDASILLVRDEIVIAPLRARED